MKLVMYQVDAFADRLFSGNPAAVIVTDEPLDPLLMQHIAEENNLSETAYVVPSGDRYSIRWFTPESEVDLCGHATLAAAKVLFDFYDQGKDVLHFDTQERGPLSVHRSGESLTLDFPADDPQEVPAPPGLIPAIGVEPQYVLKGRSDYMLVFSGQDIIERLNPNVGMLLLVEARGVICTAPGADVDFVSRFFCPSVGIFEDPVTGSAHTTLTPYWQERLGKDKMSARQLSRRGGLLEVEERDGRILISGQAQLYLKGEIEV